METKEIKTPDRAYELLGDLELEHEFWKNPRFITGLDKDSMQEFAGDIKLRGIQDPLTVLKVRNGSADKYIKLVVDGQRRKLGAEIAGFKKTAPIPVIYYSDDIIDLNAIRASKILLDIMAKAKFREGLSAYEESENAEILRKSGATLKEIGDALRRSESWVSRFLKARAKASPELLRDWRSGKITDEMFKDLAEVKPDKQAEELATAKEIRKEDTHAARGDARARAKELAQEYKQEQKTEKEKKIAAAQPSSAPKSKGKDKPAKETKHEAKATPAKAPPPTRAVFDNFVHMAERKPPTHDYVKGIMDCARYLIGAITSAKLGKPWHTYIARIEGRPRPAPKTKKSAKARKPSGKKAKKSKRK